MSIYMQIVSLLIHHITCNRCSLKSCFFFSVSMKIFIISERSNCMNYGFMFAKLFFLSKSIYFLY